MQVKKVTVRTRHGTTGSKSEKENIKAVYCHPYLNYTLSKSWEMPGWMSYKLRSRLAGERLTTFDRPMIPF